MALAPQRWTWDVGLQFLLVTILVFTYLAYAEDCACVLASYIRVASRGHA